MKKTLVALAAVLAMGAPAAWAAEASLDSLFTNTVVIRGADGSESRTRFNADGTFTTTGALEGAGVWKVEGQQFCVTPEGLEKSCSPLQPRRIGDSWTVPGPGGATLTVTLVAGR